MILHAYTHICTHMYTYTVTCTHVHIKKPKHVRTYACKQSCTWWATEVGGQTSIAHTQACTNKRIYANGILCVCVCVCVQAATWLWMNPHTHTHTHTHTCMHAYVYIYTIRCRKLSSEPLWTVAVFKSWFPQSEFLSRRSWAVGVEPSELSRRRYTHIYTHAYIHTSKSVYIY